MAVLVASPPPSTVIAMKSLMSDDGPSSYENEPDNIRDHIRTVLAKLKVSVGQVHANPPPRTKSLQAEADPKDKSSGSCSDL
jgi:hypothetical protein